MFKKDSWTLGIIIGIALPLIVYFLAILTFAQYGHVDGVIYTLRPRVPALVAIVANLLPFRYYMVNKKFDRTGRGILLTTFLFVILIFSLL